MAACVQAAAEKRRKLVATASDSKGLSNKKEQKFLEDVAKVLEKTVAKVEKAFEAEVRLLAHSHLLHEWCTAKGVLLNCSACW